MSEPVVKYSKAKGIATITLNRPDKANTLRMEVIEEMDRCLATAQRETDVKVIVLEGAGDNFCGGFDFSGGLEHYGNIKEEGYDPGEDVRFVSDQYLSYIPKFMGLWRGLKPTIAKVHGYAVGGGSELALCAEELPHDAPERVLRLRVILLLLDRAHAGQAAEYQQTRVAASNWRETVRQ